MNRYGLLEESQNKLDYVLAHTVETFLSAASRHLFSRLVWRSLIHHAQSSSLNRKHI
ncbi:hypothetical protein H0E87_026950, partial [Populus deltoides]